MFSEIRRPFCTKLGKRSRRHRLLLVTLNVHFTSNRVFISWRAHWFPFSVCADPFPLYHKRSLPHVTFFSVGFTLRCYRCRWQRTSLEPFLDFVSDSQLERAGRVQVNVTCCRRPGFVSSASVLTGVKKYQ